MSQPHKTADNICFLCRKSFSFDKGMFFAVLLRIPVNILIPLLTAYLTRYLVSMVSEQAQSLLLYVLSISGILLVLNLLNNYVTARIKYDAMFVRLRYLALIANKNMEADFQNVEDPSGQLLAQKAKNAVYSSNSGAEQMFDQLVRIFSSVIGLCTYSAILFGFVPWVVLVLLALGILSFFVGSRFSRWQYKNRDRWTEHDRHLNYLNNKAGDYKAAKDIRLFHMSAWLEELYEDFWGSRLFWYRREENHRLAVNWAGAGLTFLRDGIAYGLLVYQLISRQMEAAGFIFYFNIITQYSIWVFTLMSGLVDLKASGLSVEDIRQFLELPDRFNHGKGAPLPEGTCPVRFEQVSFRYPGAEKNTLENLSFSIKKGEKIAIVGANGAGKTTLVKLLCGLYAPTGGKILVDGRDIREYNIDEYYSLYSVVFQDIYLMPTTIARNIALAEDEQIDREKLRGALELSGLRKKVEELPEKEETLLLKGVQEKGVDLSGGEKQKLALARALYKDGKLVVLDEPTAALDPIAESETYQKYNRLISGRTSVYISHRLSSTRFCDRILFLEDGRIAEAGSHQELMELGGKYAAMFQVQSRYYQEEGMKDA